MRPFSKTFLPSSKPYNGSRDGTMSPSWNFPWTLSRMLAGHSRWPLKPCTGGGGGSPIARKSLSAQASTSYTAARGTHSGGPIGTPISH